MAVIKCFLNLLAPKIINLIYVLTKLYFRVVFGAQGALTHQHDWWPGLSVSCPQRLSLWSEILVVSVQDSCPDQAQLNLCQPEAPGLCSHGEWMPSFRNINIKYVCFSVKTHGLLLIKLKHRYRNLFVSFRISLRFLSCGSLFIKWYYYLYRFIWGHSANQIIKTCCPDSYKYSFHCISVTGLTKCHRKQVQKKKWNQKSWRKQIHGDSLHPSK